MCGKQFRTCLPEVDTVTPDAASFIYSEPQNEFPDYDHFNLGWQWSIDLFLQCAVYQKRLGTSDILSYYLSRDFH